MTGRPPWTADIDVDAALAERLIATQFPEFAAATFEPFGSGWDNAAYLVGGCTVFRLPSRAHCRWGHRGRAARSVARDAAGET